ncbi:hypothetical protein PU02_0472 [Bartonella ancashensis]|uniref:Uncharacterized protein n=1 Tax=Bartonella ancashensis TaxID=1318743 RepID=A0A0M5KSG0_9HYPH|nr:hypothetical protein PU02_0472 [Bartonella ancashensis]
MTPPSIIKDSLMIQMFICFFIFLHCIKSYLQYFFTTCMVFISG